VEVHSFQFGVQSPRDIASGQASGKRQHQSISIVKEWGASTPQLFQALVSNEVLDSVVIRLIEHNHHKRVSHTIHLSNAHVSEMRHIGGGEYRVSFSYEEIQVIGSPPPAGPVPLPYPN
jgi:type VI secretion system secreted protein Hcp